LLRASAIYAARLRRELILRNHEYAKAYGLSHALSRGGQPVVCYEPAGEVHGNFHPAAYAAILDNSEWMKRLAKAHTSKRSALPPNERGFWAELDSCNSSDALLMNIFCFPGVLESAPVRNLLALNESAVPQFGWKARVPLENGKFDRTEVDMLISDLMVEAKLTESDFQTKSKDVLRRYRDFAKVFALSKLPQTRDTYQGYQLIRNVLAAYANDFSFCVLLDERRPDLIEMWYAVMQAVKPHALRLRAKVLTYQELLPVLPVELQEFLGQKYGIGRNVSALADSTESL
jgi:hypothetical protein